MKAAYDNRMKIVRLSYDNRTMNRTISFLERGPSLAVDWSLTTSVECLFFGGSATARGGETRFCTLGVATIDFGRGAGSSSSLRSDGDPGGESSL